MNRRRAILPWSKSRRRAAFSVIELMLAVAIMGVIIYALYSVFNQTQRALRSGQTQSDVSERARAIMEMVARELEQAQPTHIGINGLQEVNMMGGLEYPPQVIRAEGRTDIAPRTNYLHNLFFLTKRANAWMGIGYRVIYVSNSVGVLQRFQSTNVLGHAPYSNHLSSAFVNERLNSTNYHHVADGVIHLSVIPFDHRGYRMGWDTTDTNVEPYKVWRQRASGSQIAAASDVTRTNEANVVLAQSFPDAEGEFSSNFAFRSNALPAYLDLQLGILEPETLAQYYTMVRDGNPNATNFLARQIGKVHLFRERIPIRTAVQ
jgi:type II secretory pathway pseudopilin PulG